MNIPKELRYTKDHEWAEVSGKTARIGITDYAQHQLGDIVFVELPAEGKKVNKGDVLATVESVKSVSDVYSPLSGVIKKVNPALEESPEQVNVETYGAGWMVELEVDNPGEVNLLLDAAAYGKLIEEA